MKLKTIHIYSILLIGVIIVIIISSHQGKKITEVSNNASNKEMPLDDVHKNFRKDNPHSQSDMKINEETKKKMQELKTAVESNPNDTLKMREYADFLLAAHKIDDAITFYEKILKKDSKRKDILFSLTYAFYNQGKLEKAEEITNRILSLDKNDSEARYNLGAILATKGEKEKAIEIWNKLIKDDPNSESAELAKNALTQL